MSCANLSATDSTFITQDVISSARIVARYQACHVTYRLRISSIMESFYIVKNELSFIMSKSSTKNLCNENLMCPENWHFNSRCVLKTTKTPVFFIAFWRNKWRSVFDIVKRLRFCIVLFSGVSKRKLKWFSKSKCWFFSKFYCNSHLFFRRPSFCYTAVHCFCLENCYTNSSHYMKPSC